VCSSDLTLAAQDQGPGNAISAIANALSSGQQAYRQSQSQLYDLEAHKQAIAPKPVMEFKPGQGYKEIGSPIPANAQLAPSQTPIELEKMKLEAMLSKTTDLKQAKQNTAELQAFRNADMSASKDAMRLSGSSGSPILDAVLKIPTMNAKTYGYTKTLLTIKNLIDNGFEKKALAAIKSDYGLKNDVDAMRRLLAIKGTPKDKMYEEIPNIRPTIGSEEAKKVGQVFTGAQNIEDLFKRWELGVNPGDITGYVLPENPMTNSTGDEQSSGVDIWGQ
jgi:hypothetical protein